MARRVGVRLGANALSVRRLDDDNPIRVEIGKMIAIADQYAANKDGKPQTLRALQKRYVNPLCAHLHILLVAMRAQTPSSVLTTENLQLLESLLARTEGTMDTVSPIVSTLQRDFRAKFVLALNELWAELPAQLRALDAMLASDTEDRTLYEILFVITPGNLVLGEVFGARVILAVNAALTVLHSALMPAMNVLSTATELDDEAVAIELARIKRALVAFTGLVRFIGKRMIAEGVARVNETAREIYGIMDAISDQLSAVIGDITNSYGAAILDQVKRIEPLLEVIEAAALGTARLASRGALPEDIVRMVQAFQQRIGQIKLPDPTQPGFQLIIDHVDLLEPMTRDENAQYDASMLRGPVPMPMFAFDWTLAAHAAFERRRVAHINKYETRFACHTDDSLFIMFLPDVSRTQIRQGQGIAADQDLPVRIFHRKTAFGRLIERTPTTPIQMLLYSRRVAFVRHNLVAVEVAAVGIWSVYFINLDTMAIAYGADLSSAYGDAPAERRAFQSDGHRYDTDVYGLIVAKRASTIPEQLRSTSVHISPSGLILIGTTVDASSWRSDEVNAPPSRTKFVVASYKVHIPPAPDGEWSHEFLGFSSTSSTSEFEADLNVPTNPLDHNHVHIDYEEPMILLTFRKIHEGMGGGSGRYPRHASVYDDGERGLRTGGSIFGTPVNDTLVYALNMGGSENLSYVANYKVDYRGNIGSFFAKGQDLFYALWPIGGDAVLYEGIQDYQAVVPAGVRIPTSGDALPLDFGWGANGTLFVMSYGNRANQAIIWTIKSWTEAGPQTDVVPELRGVIPEFVAPPPFRATPPPEPPNPFRRGARPLPRLEAVPQRTKPNFTDWGGATHGEPPFMAWRFEEGTGRMQWRQDDGSWAYEKPRR